MHMQSVQTSIGICIYQWANDIIAHGMLRSLYSGAKIVSQSESRNCTTLTGEFFMAWESQNRSATKDTYISWTLTSKWSASMLPFHRSRYRQATEVFLARWLLSRIQSQAIDEMSNVFHLTETVSIFWTGSWCFQTTTCFVAWTIRIAHITNQNDWCTCICACNGLLDFYCCTCTCTCIGVSRLTLAFLILFSSRFALVLVLVLAIGGTYYHLDLQHWAMDICDCHATNLHLWLPCYQSALPCYQSAYTCRYTHTCRYLHIYLHM